MVLRNGNLVVEKLFDRVMRERSIDRVICGEMVIQGKDKSSGFLCYLRNEMFLRLR